MTGPVATSTNTNDHVLTREEAAGVLKVSLRTLDTMVKESDVPWFRARGQMRFYLHDLLNLPRAKK